MNPEKIKLLNHLAVSAFNRGHLWGVETLLKIAEKHGGKNSGDRSLRRATMKLQLFKSLLTASIS